MSVSRPTVASYESGRTEPDIATMEKLAEIFEISVDELLGKSVEKKQLPSLYKIGLIVGAILNGIMFIRNLLFYVKDKFFYVEPGIVTEEMRKTLDIRFAIADTISFIDGYFSEIFFIGIIIIILYKYKFNEKYDLTNLLIIIITIISALLANLEISILLNPNSVRGNYYDIMRSVFWGNRKLVIVFISLVVASAVYSLLQEKMKR